MSEPCWLAGWVVGLLADLCWLPLGVSEHGRDRNMAGTTMEGV